jgi:hypothetical protein
LTKLLIGVPRDRESIVILPTPIRLRIGARDLNRWLPMVKGFLARGMFDFVEGVVRWGQRVIAYAFLLVTDRYPALQASSVEGSTAKSRSVRLPDGEGGV